MEVVMSFLVRVLRDVILRKIDDHMIDKKNLRKIHNAIPEAHILQEIKREELDADMMVYKAKRNADAQEVDLDQEVDALSAALEDLSLDKTGRKYLEAKIRFKEITWQQLMQYDFESFSSILKNEMQDFNSLKDKKLIIIARMKVELKACLLTALQELNARDPKPIVQLELEERPLQEVPCVDQWLLEQIKRIIQDAQKLELMIRGKSVSGVGGFKYECGPGSTGALLKSCLDIAETLDELMSTVDGGKLGIGAEEPAKQAHVCEPGSKYALKDFYESKRKSDDPIDRALMRGMEYIFENIDRTAEYNSGRSSYYMSLKHDAKRSEGKLYDFAFFVRQMKLAADENPILHHLAILNILDNFMARSKQDESYISTDRLTICFSKIHEDAVKRAPETASRLHREVCKVKH